MTGPDRQRLWADYGTFHQLAVTTSDVDPVYPVLRHILADATPAERTEAIVLYVAYYDLGSGLTAVAERRAGTSIADLPLNLPCATERRAHRDRRQLARHLGHLHEVARHHDGLHRFLSQELPAAPRSAWSAVRTRVELVHGNGRWASYKTAELLQKVAGWPIDAPDMGMAGASGPAHGLRMLIADEGDPPAVMERHGATVAAGLHVDGRPGTELSTVETTLCDFHALADGNYYVGHDIDAMQAQLDHAPAPAAALAFAGRAAALPHAYLGEISGWHGVDRARKRVYRETGQIVERPH